MKRLLIVSLVLLVCTVASCARVQGEPESKDVPSGTWIGDFGPAFYDRNTISLELKWDGKVLTGTVKPGTPGGRMYRNFEGFPIEKASFDPNTGVVKFEAMYQPRGRRYIIEGKLKGNTLSGTWNRPDENKDGDFKLTRKTE
jgi:predicted small secreted protein